MIEPNTPQKTPPKTPHDDAAPRHPHPTRLARMGALATLPLFLKARGKKVVVAGGGAGALWKAELLKAAGARVEIFAPDACDDLTAFAADDPNIALHRRLWSPEDLQGARLAVCDETIDIDAFRAAADHAGVLVNAIDRPAHCDVQFGSIVNRSPLIVSISTDGAAPVFGQALRARIETLLPAGFSAWAQAARAWRDDLAPLKLDFRARRAFWERFTALALRRPRHPPQESDRLDLMRDVADSAAQNPKPGKAWLVGAGPGDAELLTLRAARALQSADVVLYDDLVSPDVLDLARREAERVNVGKRGHKPSCGQDEICALLVELTRAGKTVARLKGGDPLIFGRANEEIAALQAAGLEVEVVPGVTAASAAGASLLASLTERDSARRLQFVTAHSRHGGLPEDLNWAALADPKASTAVYMGLKTLPALAARLLQEGLPADTPCVLVERASWPDERKVCAPLSEIHPRVAQADMRGPGLLLIGEAFRAARA